MDFSEKSGKKDDSERFMAREEKWGFLPKNTKWNRPKRGQNPWTHPFFDPFWSGSEHVFWGFWAESSSRGSVGNGHFWTTPKGRDPGIPGSGVRPEVGGGPTPGRGSMTTFLGSLWNTEFPTFPVHLLPKMVQKGWSGTLKKGPKRVQKGVQKWPLKLIKKWSKTECRNVRVLPSDFLEVFDPLFDQKWGQKRGQKRGHFDQNGVFRGSCFKPVTIENV